jgi:putative chitinase
MGINRKVFYDSVRPAPFGGRITLSQKQGMDVILDEWDRRGLTDLRWLAYMLATAKHETAHTMQPIKEGGGQAYFTRMYDIAGSRPDLARRNGNTTAGDGARYCGRGFVQLTWRNNYRKMGKLLSIPLEANPDLAMRPEIACQILFEGMTRGESNFGDFTGKALEDYFSATKNDPREARRIINGTDRAADIAKIHEQFLDGLELANAPTETPMVVPTVAPPSGPDFEEVSPSQPIAPPPMVPAPTVAPAPYSQASGNLSKAQIEGVQARLRELGYFIVGNVDGDPAERTKDAIVLFRRNNGLPLSEEIDADFLMRLATATPLVMPGRDNATEKSVAPKVDAMAPTLGTRLWAKLTAIPTAIFAVITGVGEHWQTAKEKLTPVYDFTASIPLWVYFALIASAAFLIWKKSNEASAAMVKDYQMGKTL